MWMEHIVLGRTWAKGTHDTNGMHSTPLLHPMKLPDYLNTHPRHDGILQLAVRINSVGRIKHRHTRTGIGTSMRRPPIPPIREGMHYIRLVDVLLIY